ncbi:MAG: fibronectin type III domain-containing protein [Candidatus Kapabacteria bacterium]|nr:fibronectin type III domain-containing protein [Candidatus Kapabacteria bacterium]
MKAWRLALSVLGASLFFVGCEDTGTQTPVKFIPAPPSNLMAVSLSETSIRLKWTPSPSESNAEFRGYRITAVSGNQTFAPLTTGKGQTIVDIVGLDAGKKYTFTVVAITADTASSGISLEWAGARRFRGIRAFETASANGSGIRLSDGTNLTIANGTQWDVCLDTRVVGGQDNWAFGSPQASTYTDDQGRFLRGAQAGQPAKVTIIFSDSSAQGYTPYFVVADSLEAVFENQALGTGKKQVQIMVENLQNQTRNLVFYAKTAEGNFAKIMLKAIGGKILQGTAPNRYVEIDYSFQTAANVPYALAKGTPAIDNPRIVKIGSQSMR